MTGSLDHLAPAVREIAGLPDYDRIAYIDRDHFINFDQATRALHYLEEIFGTTPRTRMPCLLMTGPSGIGKSKIIEAFLKRHPKQAVAIGGARRMTVPALSVQMPAEADHAALLEAMLFSIGGSPTGYRNARQIEQVLYRLLLEISVRIIFIDEFHNLHSAIPRRRDIVLNTLKNLTNELRIPLVAVGTEEARITIGYDKQMARRFSLLELHPFVLDNEFHSFLRTYVAHLPLRRPSDVDSASVRKHLIAITEGITVNLMTYLRRAAIEAIRNGSEKLDLLADEGVPLPLVSMNGKRLPAAQRV